MDATVSSFSQWDSVCSRLSGRRQPQLRYDFVSVLSVAQHLGIDFLPIMWQPALDVLGAGGTAEIRQALVNLQVSFAFKRVTPSTYENFKEIEVLSKLVVNEMSIHAHPKLRCHPNIQRLEGLCWDSTMEKSSSHILPVLVMEKTRHGDLSAFADSAHSKSLSPEERLRICVDVAFALADMHSCGIIHGDVKPGNILIFRKPDGAFTAKISDFGYSSIAFDSQLVYLPRSDPWTAPEYHHRGFVFTDARKMDIYSFGLTCLWFVLYNVEEEYPTISLLMDLKIEENLHGFLQELEEKISAVRPFGIPNLVEFFTRALAPKSAMRSSNLIELITLLGFDKALMLPDDAAMISDRGHCDFELLTELFVKIAPCIEHFVTVDYRVRSYIVRCLQKQILVTQKSQNWLGSSFSNTLFQLAICFQIGFGVKRDTTLSWSLLSQSARMQEDLQYEIQVIHSRDAGQSFHDGIFSTLFAQGDISTMTFKNYYPKGSPAITIYRSEVEDFEAVFGLDNHLPCTLNFILSFILIGEGNLDEAQSILISSHSRNTRVLEPGHQYTLMSALALAYTYSEQGLWDQALHIKSEALKISMVHHGPEHSSTLSLMSNMAATYEALRQYDKAEEIFLNVRDARLATLGPEHPVTLTAAANIAANYMSQERYDDAALIDVDVCNTRGRVLGNDHPDTLICRSNIACRLFEQGRFSEAEAIEREILETRKTLLGSEHPDTILSLENYARTIEMLDQRAESQKLQEEVVILRLRILGSDHPKTLRSVANLASTYLERGFHAEAEMVYLAVLQTMLKILTIQHPDTLLTMENMAPIYEVSSRWKEARVLYAQVSRVRQETLGPDDEGSKESAWKLESVTRMCPNLPMASNAHDAGILETKQQISRPEFLVPGSEHEMIVFDEALGRLKLRI